MKQKCACACSAARCRPRCSTPAISKRWCTAHSSVTFQDGITQAYAGHSTRDFLNDHAENEFDNPWGSKPSDTSACKVVKQPVTIQEIIQWQSVHEPEKEDLNSEIARQRARKGVRHARREVLPCHRKAGRGEEEQRRGQSPRQTDPKKNGREKGSIATSSLVLSPSTPDSSTADFPWQIRWHSILLRQMKWRPRPKVPCCRQRLWCFGPFDQCGFSQH